MILTSKADTLPKLHWNSFCENTPMNPTDSTMEVTKEFNIFVDKINSCYWLSGNKHINVDCILSKIDLRLSFIY